jgi:hypothetical protein
MMRALKAQFITDGQKVNAQNINKHYSRNKLPALKE